MEERYIVTDRQQNEPEQIYSTFLRSVSQPQCKNQAAWEVFSHPEEEINFREHYPLVQSILSVITFCFILQVRGRHIYLYAGLVNFWRFVTQMLYYLSGMLLIFLGITTDGIKDNLSGRSIISLTSYMKIPFSLTFHVSPLFCQSLDLCFPANTAIYYTVKQLSMLFMLCTQNYCLLKMGIQENATCFVP